MLSRFADGRCALSLDLPNTGGVPPRYHFLTFHFLKSLLGFGVECIGRCAVYQNTQCTAVFLGFSKPVHSGHIYTHYTAAGHCVPMAIMPSSSRACAVRGGSCSLLTVPLDPLRLSFDVPALPRLPPWFLDPPPVHVDY